MGCSLAVWGVGCTPIVVTRLSGRSRVGGGDIGCRVAVSGGL